MRSTQVLCTCDWCGRQETCPFTGSSDRLEIPDEWRLLKSPAHVEKLMCSTCWALCAQVLPSKQAVKS